MKRFLAVLFVGMLALGCAPKKGAVEFEKLVFHSSRCFGYCPVYQLQINSDKSFLLSKEDVARNAKQSSIAAEPTKIEYFKGVVSDADYNNLLNQLLKTDSLNLNGETCCDGTLKTIIAYYNGKRKYTQTMFPTNDAEKLIGLLLNICKSEGLAPTGKFEIEQPEVEQASFEK